MQNTVIREGQDRMSEYLLGAEEAISQAGSAPDGLAQPEAAKRLAKDGPNKLDEAKKDSFAKRFLKQVADPMIIMLIVAAAISAGTAFYERESFADVFIILFVVCANATLGIIQESKAEAAIQALKDMTAATSKVLRDGAPVLVKSEEIVAGDVVLLEAGDLVPADGRIIESASLKVEEASLTGESVPVSKFVEALTLQEGQSGIPLGDRKNMAYMGTTVTYGRGRQLVTQTGMKTQMGKIATAISEASEGQTPLQIKLSELSKLLSKIVVGICAVVFAATMLQSPELTAEVVLDDFMIAVALAVAAIPEGLPAVVTIVLSMGVTKMSKRKAVIRRLMAVETLGSTQIICSDKTGTLTQNKMAVTEHASGSENLLARAMSLCSDARIENGKEIGDPTEVALVAYAERLGMPKAGLESSFPRIGEAPFDSSRKMMSTVHRVNSAEPGAKPFVQFTKGAPDLLLTRCTRRIEGGGTAEMSESDRAEILASNKSFADRALRVLAAAYREYDSEPESYEAESLEQGMAYIGLVGMIDPSRPEAAEAIKLCRQAGIRPIMITGDHRDTAVAIAKDLGMASDASEAMTGEEIEKMSDEELYEKVESVSVYARVQPEHKVRIVSAWQKRGKITAMTGDGVNDAPSIKTADIGVGMGITGTDVTKNVADMVLADDNFATIVSAVEEGRRIFDNIKKVIMFQFSTNLGEVISVFAASMMGFNLFAASHLLWINLITDTAPGLALGMEEAEGDIMKRRPRPPEENIFHGIMIDLFAQGFFIALATIASFFIGHWIEFGAMGFNDSAHGTTMAFLTLSMVEIFQAFNMRSLEYSVFGLKRHNKYLYWAMAASFALTAAVIYIPPLASMFGFAGIGLKEYGIALALASSIVPVVEAVKAMTKFSIEKSPPAAE
jgi:Ca2+-transporting ATPase